MFLHLNVLFNKSKINEEDEEYKKSLKDKNTKNSKLNVNPINTNSLSIKIRVSY